MMGKCTEKGLIFIIAGLVLSILSNLLIFLTGGEISYALGISSISGILVLIGIILMVVGRKEYGDRHGRFVIYALAVFLVSIAFYVIYTVYTGIMVYIAVYEGNVDLSGIKNIIYLIPFAAILGGLVNVFLLHELENRNGRIILYAAFLVTIFTSIMVAVMATPFMDALIVKMESTIDDQPLSLFANELTTELEKGLSQLNIYGVVNNLMFLVAAIIPYRRIKSGELAAAPSSPEQQ